MEKDNGRDIGSAAGLMHCLRFLADEAASLNLFETFRAIETALLMARSETARPH